MTSQLPEFFDHVVTGSPAYSVHELALDDTKISWYKNRVEAWARGEKIAPVTIDCAWTRQCQAACVFCAAQTQANDGGGRITKQNAFDFLDDAAEIGVRGISLISDGESTIVPWYEESIEHAAKVGIKVGIGSNGIRLKRKMLERILPHVSYIRFNFSAGTRAGYKSIMGLKDRDYDQVIQNVKDAMEIKRRNNLTCNINMQVVLMPSMAEEIMPFARLCKEVRPDYGILKQCVDAIGDLGVDYKEYDKLTELLQEAESLSDDDFRMVVKWNRIKNEGKRDYKHCHGTAFLLQVSGSGLVGPCGPLFNEKFKKMHLGSIVTSRFRDIWASDRYWEVMRYLSSDEWDSQRNCPVNCLQTQTNSWLDKFVKGTVSFNTSNPPPQMEFL